MGGSHFALVEGLSGGEVPKVDAELAKDLPGVAQGDLRGLVRACHDLSEGGLAVAAAEMAFAGGLGAKISLADVPLSFRERGRGEGAPLSRKRERGRG